MNGKGSNPRNCFSKQFKSNYDEINWNKPVNNEQTSKHHGTQRKRLKKIPPTQSGG